MWWKQPETISLEVDLGGMTFAAEGSAPYVISAYALFLQQIQLAEKAETEIPQLPMHRIEKVGTC